MIELKLPYPCPIEFKTWLIIDNIPPMDELVLWWLLDVDKVDTILDKRMVQSAQHKTNKSVVLVYDTIENANRAFVSFQLKFQLTPFLALKVSDALSYIEDCQKSSKSVNMGSDVINCVVNYKFSAEVTNFEHLFSLFGKHDLNEDKGSKKAGKVIYENVQDAVAAVWGLDGQNFKGSSLKVWRCHAGNSLQRLESTLVLVFREKGHLPFTDFIYEKWLSEHAKPVFPFVYARDMELTKEEQLAVSICNIAASAIDCKDKYCSMNVTHSVCSELQTCIKSNKPCSEVPFSKVRNLLEDAVKTLGVVSKVTEFPPQTITSPAHKGSSDASTKQIQVPELKITLDSGEETKLKETGDLVEKMDSSNTVPEESTEVPCHGQPVSLIQSEESEHKDLKSSAEIMPKDEATAPVEDATTKTSVVRSESSNGTSDSKDDSDENDTIKAKVVRTASGSLIVVTSGELPKAPDSSDDVRMSNDRRRMSQNPFVEPSECTGI